MSLDHFRGSAWAVRTLLRAAARETEANDGELRAAKILYRTANPKKVALSLVTAARLLRFGWKKS